jgi:hypothetical protein
MTIFVLMKSVGEYSEREEYVIGYTTNEDRVKELVIEYTNNLTLEYKIEKAKKDLNSHFYNEYTINNPEPCISYEFADKIKKPVFDQNKHKDKEYVKEHTKAKDIYKAEWAAASTEAIRVWKPIHEKWKEEYAIALEKHTAENFNINLCNSSPWIDFRFYYEKCEQLE